MKAIAFFSKLAKDLSTGTEARKHVAKKDFVFPGKAPKGESKSESHGSYPVPDARHRAAAAGLCALHHGANSPTCRAVHRKIEAEKKSSIMLPAAAGAGLGGLMGLAEGYRHNKPGEGALHGATRGFGSGLGAGVGGTAGAVLGGASGAGLAGSLMDSGSIDPKWADILRIAGLLTGGIGGSLVGSGLGSRLAGSVIGEPSWRAKETESKKPTFEPAIYDAMARSSMKPTTPEEVFKSLGDTWTSNKRDAWQHHYGRPAPK